MIRMGWTHKEKMDKNELARKIMASKPKGVKTRGHEQT